MSWQAMAWVDDLPYEAVSPLAFRVLVKLANAAASDGTRAFRSKRQLADELGVSERSIQRAFRELEAAAVVKRGDQRLVAHMPANRRPTVYDVQMHAAQADMALVPGWNDDGSGETSRGDTVIHRGDTPGPSGETTGVAITVLEQPTTHLRENDTSRRRERARSTQRDMRFSTAVCPSTMDRHRYNPRFGTCVDCGALPIPHVDGARS